MSGENRITARETVALDRGTQVSLTQFKDTYLLTFTTQDTTWQAHLGQEDVARLHALLAKFAGHTRTER